MKVLVVDDEPLARARLAALVAEIGGATVVGEAANGLQALEMAQASGPEVVLLDVRMPGMDGVETARHLARLPCPPAVVFTTAYEVHALSAFEVRAIDYLLKPIRRERLAEALLLEESLRQLEAELGARFLRVHRNALVAPAHAEAVERGDDGLYHVRLRGVGLAPAVSRRLLAGVRERLRGR